MSRDDGRAGERAPDLSVVIPSYNSAPWLPSTLDALSVAVARSARDVEVIVVDDGSTDETRSVVEALRGDVSNLRLISQPNRGRFLARWEGIESARSDLVLLLDSRVVIDADALRYVFESLTLIPERRTWNAHIDTAADAPLIGRFWDVPTYIFWGAYLRDPRPFDITDATFDSAPKGTTMFLAPRDVLRDAFVHAWPTSDTKLVSDDTKVLRRIAQHCPIRIDPGFSAVYRPRTTVRGFVRHTFDRGTLFVDSYAGTGVLRALAILLAVLAPVFGFGVVALLAVQSAWPAVVALVAGALVLILAPVVPAVRNRCPRRSVLAYVVCLPVFVGPFWAGLARGLFLHRRAFRRAQRSTVEGQHR